jgi:hypothetical protein
MQHGKETATEARYVSPIRFRVEVAAEMADRHGARTDTERAAFFGVTPWQYSRVTSGKRGPGSEFIAAAVAAAQAVDPSVTFHTLFEVAAA